MLEAYRTNVAERDLQGIPPKSLDPKRTAGLVELSKNPPPDEKDFLIDLIATRGLPGVNEAAYSGRFE
jgi:aconitate hydratase 2/2-methylisocitrate dehydratase